MNKTCYKCQRELPISSFATTKNRKDGRQGMCRECQKAYRRNHYLKNRSKYIDKAKDWNQSLREWFWQLKSTLQCTQCSENHPACLDFHHRDPKTKIDGVSQLVTKGNKQAVLDEIDKCDVLCRNCHAKLHAAVV